MTMQTIKSIARIISGFLLAAASLICIVLLIAYTFGCSEKPKTISEVSVIWDVTEAHSPRPEAGEIIPLLALDEPTNGATFRFTYASDVSFNHETVFILPVGGNAITTNQFDRKRKIEKFKQQIAAFLDSLSDDTVGRPNSSLFVPMAKSLNQLAASAANRKYLLVYSDLRENSSVMSFYNPKILALLQNDSAKAEALLAAQEQLGELNGIEIHLLYQPKDAADDAGYRIISGFYKSLFERKGAKVFISANLTE